MLVGKSLLKKFLSWVTISFTILVIGCTLNFAIISPVSAAEKVVNNCTKPGDSMFLSLDTKSYAINICGGDKPYDMVIAKKPSGSPERFPFQESSANGNYFMATNADRVYILSKTPKGNVFTITKMTSTEMLREFVNGW